MSFVVFGLAACGMMGLAFLIHEVRNAPYCDDHGVEQLLAEIDKQTRDMRQFT